MEMILNYIDGKLSAPKDNDYLDNINPATGKVYSKVPSSKRVDVELAVESAKAAFSSWKKSNS